MRTIVYSGSTNPGPVKAGAGERVFYRHAPSWNGEVEDCDRCLSDAEAIREAYQARGIKAEPLTKPKPKPRAKRKTNKK